MPLPSQALSINARLLKAKVTKSAIIGVCISIFAIIIATTISGYFLHGEVRIPAFIMAQQKNPVLWFLEGNQRYHGSF